MKEILNLMINSLIAKIYIRKYPTLTFNIRELKKSQTLVGEVFAFVDFALRQFGRHYENVVNADTL